MIKPINVEILPYRLGVGVMLLNPHNQVFVGKRIDTISDAWQMPQGGIDKSEDPLIAAKRELREETGIEQVKILGESANWYHYDLPETIIPKIWGGKYRGQKQKWYIMRFLGNDEEINLTTTEPEFLAYQWVPAEELPNLIVPFKRSLYQQILAEFLPYFTKF